MTFRESIIVASAPAAEPAPPAPEPARRRSIYPQVRASRLRKRVREGGLISPDDRRWLEKYDAIKRPRAKATTDEVIAAVCAVAEVKRAQLRSTGDRMPRWIEAARRLLMIALIDAGHRPKQIESITGVQARSARVNTLRARREIAAGGTLAARLDAVWRRIESARSTVDVAEADRRKAMGRRRPPRAQRDQVAREGEIVYVPVRIGSPLWAYIDKLAEADELAAVGTNPRSRRDRYVCE